MSKFYAMVGVLSVLLVQPPLFAGNAGNTTAGTDTTKTDTSKADSSKAAPPEKKTASGGKHGGHEHSAGRKSVLALSSLTAKQKEEINAIYDGNKAKWEDLQKQLHDLKDAEWAKVKPILTADQITELQQAEANHHNKHKTSGTSAGSAAPASESAN